MHTHVKTTDCTLSAIEARLLERRLARIEHMVPRANADLLHLHLVVERTQRRAEFRCSLRLTLESRVLATNRQVSHSIHTLLTEAFDRLEARVNRVREARIDRRTRKAAQPEPVAG